jgi:glycosyltransferase involved in cell wall biosynthesis
VTEVAPPPLQALPHDDLIKNWGGLAVPKCSVLVPTYMHERFLPDALNGILAQQTDFPFEVIVRDDASSDDTAAVARHFCSLYPGIVSLIANPRRTYPQESTLRELQLRAKGEFVAICEGDDYWTDSNKLKAQVEALQRSTASSLAFHDSVTVDFRRDPAVIVNEEIPLSLRRDRDGSDVARRAVPFRSLLYRNHPNAPLPLKYNGRMWTEDTFLSVRLGLLGNALYVPNVSPSVYRLHDFNLTTKVLERPHLRTSEKIQAFLLIAEYLKEKGRENLAGLYLHRALLQLASLIDSESVPPNDQTSAQITEWALERLTWRDRASTLLRSVMIPLRFRKFLLSCAIREEL